MKVEYASDKLKKKCSDLKSAQKLFSGDKSLARSLLARINALESAETLKDIIVQRPFHFHKLANNMEGYFAIDVKSRRDPWRIILEPLDAAGERYVPCHIDEIVEQVRIVEIAEVSKHYE
ncbi:MAG: hypothetical protein Q4C56_00055 [Peptococcaceae bacterium]|nr:hypothetical protein [Peptococcaceae bacterium]